MIRWINANFWGLISRLILRNRVILLLIVAGITVFMSMQWKHMQFSFTEANLLPDDHEYNLQYEEFLSIFGEEGNMIVLAIKDSAFFESKNIGAWNRLTDTLASYPEVAHVVSIGNLKTLQKNLREKRFELAPLSISNPKNQKQADQLKSTLFQELPFYESLLFNKKTGTVQTAIYLDKKIVNKLERKLFVYDILIPAIKQFEKDNNLNIRASGMPYVRTLNAQNIVDEIGMFVVVAMLVTTLIFFFFFRSFRATFISMFVVIIGVMWAFGVLGLLNYEITVLTALIPPLIIVIGVPNCIFLINKYQHEVKKHGNQARSLQRVISKIGNATLMTNLTTASGFATFMLTNSQLLKEFGQVASINIMLIFVLSLLMIPIIYSILPLPNEKHLKHLSSRWMVDLVHWMERMVRHYRIQVYMVSIIALVLSVIGIYQIKLSGSMIEDMPKKTEFVDDIRFFDKEFDGIMPIEIMIDTRRKKGVMKLATLRRMNALDQHIQETPELSAPFSVVNVVKYIKQAYYNGNPNYFQLPSAQENNFIFSYAKKSSSDLCLLNSIVDSTGQIARMTTRIRDISTEKMEAVEAHLMANIQKHFPDDRYTVTVTGKALGYLKGTRYLIKNLVLSLSLAILLISMFMAYMFRSWRMILISLIPNLLPLLVTAGMMGFLGIPIKPSTILVFSIAFGISVDDTIHFLVKYRQELKANKWKIVKSVYAALYETGISMFYTSIVLFFGFSVFMISSFGGTVALGGLVSATLLFAMLANLILLPSLLISLEKSISNKKVLKEPKFNLIPNEDEEITTGNTP